MLWSGCFAEPDPVAEAATEGTSASSSATQALSSSEDSGVGGGSSETGCIEGLDACGICGGPGGPCLGCDVPEASNFNPLADVYDGTCACLPIGTPLADAAQLDADAGAGGLSQWQSFTAEVGGGLHGISIQLSSPLELEASPGVLEVFEGEGVEGNRLVSADIEIAPSMLSTLQEFLFSELVPVAKGRVYSWRLTVPAQTAGFLALNISNPYAGGRFETDPGTDAVFRVEVRACMPQ